MKVQQVHLPDGKVSWMVLGDDLLPVEPIQKYLSYIENLQKSPNTIQSLGTLQRYLEVTPEQKRKAVSVIGF